MSTHAGGTAKSETTGAAEAAEKRDFRVTMMFHPSHDVLDLGEAERWYERLFGRSSTSLASIIASLPSRPGPKYPSDYSTFTPICDVLFDTIDPKRYLLDGVQRLPSVEEPHLRLISWYVDGMTEAFREIKRHGIRVEDQLEELVEGDEPPTAHGAGVLLYYTVAEDTGLRYSFFPAGMFHVDPRTEPGWVVPPVSADDPLGIERCSHHTVVTDRPERAVKLLVDVLGGDIVHEGRNELLGATSTYVHLAGSILEYAIPDSGTAAHEDWATGEPNDTYHSITWKVADLERAERHLEAQGVRIRSRSHDTIVTDPATSLGIPWGFSTTVTPGDPRGVG